MGGRQRCSKRRVVGSKKRSTALIRQQIEWARLRHGRRYPFTLLCKKQTKPHHIFRYKLRLRRGRKPPVDDSVAVYPFARRRNFMHFASHDRIFTISFLLPSSAFRPLVLQLNPAQPDFCTSYHFLIKFIINQQIRKLTHKNSRYVVHIVNEKVVHSEIQRL